MTANVRKPAGRLVRAVEDTINSLLPQILAEPELLAFHLEMVRLVGMTADADGYVSWDMTPEQMKLFEERVAELSLRIKARQQ